MSIEKEFEKALNEELAGQVTSEDVESDVLVAGASDSLDESAVGSESELASASELEIISSEHKIVAVSDEEDPIVPKNESTISEQSQFYFAGKAENHNNIIEWIGEAERELADLKLRKALMEADFEQLLAYVKEIFVENSLPASTIAKTSLLEYFTFELFKPLTSADLTLSQTEFEVWQTKNFSLGYQLINQKEIQVNLSINQTTNQQVVAPITLLTVFPETMAIQVKNEAVYTLLKKCHAERVYTIGQVSMVNFQLNEVLTHLKKLGFTFNENLLDNSKPLHLTVELAYEVSADILDEIFITTMQHPEFDFDVLAHKQYLIQLENNQTVTVTIEHDAVTEITLNTDQLTKSLLEFFGQYSFLVPLVIDATSF